jgi:ubiquinone/menaquinone biosynthesis C-methylase UbiE
MLRIPEPELMCSIEQVEAFQQGDKTYSIRAFLEQWDKFVFEDTGSVIDLGSGTADYLIALSQKYPKLSITGYDASEVMVEKARSNVKDYPIQIFCSHFDNIYDSADVVISTNTLHHQTDTEMFWKTASRLGKKILVTDILRPENVETAKLIVQQYADKEPFIFQQDFYNSLLAAFTEDEILEQIKNYDLKIETVTGRFGTLKTVIVHGNL